MNLLGNISVGFGVIYQLLARVSHSSDSGVKWEYNETVHQLYLGFKKAYDSFRRHVFYNIFTEFGVTMKLVRLIKMCLNEMFEDRIGKYLPDNFPTQNGLKQREISPLLFNFVLKYAIRKIQKNHTGLKLNGTYQLLVYADDVNLLGGNRVTIKKNIETSIGASKEIGLEANADKTKFMLLSRHQNAGEKS
jgi:hypothetical protein